MDTDTRGHLIGEVTLHAVAQALNNNIRRINLAARYGGEELFILLPDTDLTRTEDIAARPCDAHAASVPLKLGPLS